MNVLEVFATRTYAEQRCGGCGVWFAMDAEDRRSRIENNATFYCPNGCQRHFTARTEAERLREELRDEQASRQRAEREAEHQRGEREAARRSLIALRGHTTRLKKRVAKGACPSCHARFKDLASHMAEQHPTYADGTP